MAEGSGPGWQKFASNYNSTSQEIKSHSSVLFNERLNTLFMMYDTEAIDMEINPSIKKLLRARSLLHGVWRNVRPIVSNNQMCRNILKLNTSKQGLYTIDVGFAHIQECISEMIALSDYSYSKLIYTAHQINSVEIVIREVMQYFNYFIRPEYKQKPDINVASEKYKNMADERTVEQFRNLLGHNSVIAAETMEIPIEEDYFDDIVDYLEDPNSQDKEDLQEDNFGKND